MTLEEMRERKKELGYSYEQIAKLADLPVGTVQKVLGGFVKSPRYQTLKALEEVFAAKPARVIREETLPCLAQKAQGEFTVEDYNALPDERRVELIDGVIYDMSSPIDVHQLLVGEIYARLRDYIQKNKGQCIPMVSPLDVQLDCDNKTMVQPDVMIVCDRNKFIRGKLFGAPDFVVEVLSPSTRKKDSLLKTQKYENAGVREYWTIDPKGRRVVVYDFEHGEWPVIYGFDKKVPVGIFGGKCEIDFAEVYDYISFLYQMRD